MNCYVIWDKRTNYTLKVYPYFTTIKDDWKRAEQLALNFAHKNHAAGYPTIVEVFHMCSVGKQVLDTEKAEQHTEGEHQLRHAGYDPQEEI